MSTIRGLLFLLVVINVRGDVPDRTGRKGVMFKLLREMVNQTKADTLNLPANATSIRENITDTFSCENRTYGYYADVDNECQVFHVCLTSESATGRNTTYRWSFICPNETMFNQEVLTCTRPRDAINCEDSPMYYDLNNDIGKMPNNTKENMKRRKIMKKNLVIENLLDEVKRIDIEELDKMDGRLMPYVEEILTDEVVDANTKYKFGRDIATKDDIVKQNTKNGRKVNIVKDEVAKYLTEKDKERYKVDKQGIARNGNTFAKLEIANDNTKYGNEKNEIDIQESNSKDFVKVNIVKDEIVNPEISKDNVTHNREYKTEELKSRLGRERSLKNGKKSRGSIKYKFNV